MSNIPDGFELMAPFGPSHESIGPIYFKLAGAQWLVGMRVEERHHNRGPMIHGGIMAFFVDTAFTYVCHRLRHAESKSSLTTHLSIDYLGPATAGDWIEAHVDPMRVGKRVAFFSGMVFNGAQRIARASALFQIIS